jgi:tetratricopeptide (TPR) repeat protein
MFHSYCYDWSRLALTLVLVVLAGAGLSAQEADRVAASGVAFLDDEEVLRRASELDVDQLKELLGAYARLGKKDLCEVLADELLKKDPTNAAALRVKEGKPPFALLEAEAMAADRFSAEIDALRRSGRYGEMARALSARKRAQESGGAFRFQLDLADAYQQSGNREAAKREYRVLAGSGYPDAERAAARRALGEIAKTEKVAAAVAALKIGDIDTAMAIAEEMLAKSPKDGDALSLKAVALSETGQHDAGLAILEEMKARHRGNKFPFDPEIAGIHLSAKNFDQAEAMYLAMGGVAGASGMKMLKKSRAIEAAYEAIKRGRGREALVTAEEMLLTWPQDQDVAVLHGEALLAVGRSGEAVAELAAAKEKYYSHARVFPGQNGLALGRYRSNDLAGAKREYAEVLDGEGYKKEDRDDAIIHNRQIGRDLGSELRLDGQWTKEDEGEAQRATVYAHSALKDGWRFWGWGHVESINLSEASILKTSSAERFEGGIAVERRSDKWNGALRVGASDSDAIGGIEISRHYNNTASWYFEGGYNERADDSLSLGALDGRQHRGELGVYVQLAPKVSLEASGYLRQVEVLGDSIGDGWGWAANLDYTIVEAYKRRPALRVGYAGDVHIFNGERLGSEIDPYLKPGLSAAGNPALVDALVEPEYIYHGIHGQLEGMLSVNIAYFLTGKLQYDFTAEKIQYQVGAGFETFLNDRISLTAGVDYYSSGQGVSSFAGVIVGNLGLAMQF